MDFLFENVYSYSRTSKAHRNRELVLRTYRAFDRLYARLAKIHCNYVRTIAISKDEKFEKRRQRTFENESRRWSRVGAPANFYFNM